MNNRFTSKLAVCSWSLQPTTPGQLVDHLKQIGLNQIQCALDPLREQPAVWGNLPQLCATHQIRIVSGMFGTIGEDYSSLESIRRTGGVVPDATWPENWKNIQAIADLAAKLNLKLVTFHAGFLPHDPAHPEYKKLLSRILQIADLFAGKKIDLGFETGQETADTLRDFLKQLSRSNVGVNFDPANMLLYDKGDPISSLRTLGPWLKQCHLKDALKTKKPGSWGEEVPVGKGEVDWRRFFQTLDDLKFDGYLCIEREAGQQRIADIKAGREFVEKTVSP